jgi:hypothetical protein
VLHRPAVGDAAGNLLGDAFRYQFGIDLRHLDLFDPKMHFLVDRLLEHLAQALHIGALLPNNDPGLRCVERDVDLVRRALQLDPGDASPSQLVHDQPPDAQIFMKLLRVVPLRIPLRFPIGNDAQTKSNWIDLASH